MTNNNYAFKALLPFVFLIICNLLSQWFLNDLYSLSSGGANHFKIDNYKYLKFFFVPLSQILLALVSYLLYKRIGLYRLIQLILTISAMIVSLFTVGQAFKVLRPEMVAGILEEPTNYEELLYKWDIVSFFIFTHLWPSITLLLFYGYANQRFSFKEAGRYYPLFGACAIVLSQLLLPEVYNYITKLSRPSPLLYTGAISCLLILAPKLCYSYMQGRKEIEKDAKETKDGLGWKYAFYVALLAITVGVIMNISIITSNFDIRLKDKLPGQYWRLLESYTHFKEISTFLAIMTMVFLSSYMCRYSSKGWRHFSYAGTVFGVSLGLLILLLHLYGNCFSPLISETPSNKMISTISNVGAGYQILLSNVLYPLLMCLKELSIVPLESDKKFPALLCVDLIFWKAGYFIVVIFQEILWGLHGIAPPVLMFLTLALLVTLSFRLMLIEKIGRRIEKAVQ